MRFLSILFLALLLAPILSAQQTNRAPSARPELNLPLSRGRMFAYDLPPPGAPTAILVFVSGAGGWTYWDDSLCRHLSRGGLYVLGLDLAAYAATPYTPDNLASDLERIAAAAVPPQDADRVPILYGGVGAGAAQALLAALPPAPARLMGLLLINPPARGDCSPGLLERFGFSPHGDESFSLAEKARAFTSLPVAAAYNDQGWLIDTAWLNQGPFPHHLFPFTQSLRHFLRVDKPLLDSVDAAVEWLLHS